MRAEAERQPAAGKVDRKKSSLRVKEAEKRKSNRDEDFEAIFILNSYKTAKTMGRATFSATPELVRVLRKWREMNVWASKPFPYLLRKGSESDVVMSESDLGTRLGDLSEKYAGKRATLNILRHSFVSKMREREMSLLSKSNLSQELLHTIGMNELYRRIPRKRIEIDEVDPADENYRSPMSFKI